MENWWQKPITALKGIGSKRAEAFARLEIVTIGDTRIKNGRQPPDF